MNDFLWTEAADPIGTMLLAHGSGAAMDSPFLEKLAAALAGEGLSVARFEFPYMALRRKDGRRRPPPKAETLVDGFRATIEAVLADPRCVGRLLIGGKSMGGRVSAMVGGTELPERVAGVVAYGYPFHPPGQPDELRLAPLEGLRLPALVLQGERDEFGARAEVEGYAIPSGVTIEYIEDGSHDFGPRGQSPATLKGNILHAAQLTATFLRRLA
ncbi:alpha/beta family hydrolase [Methyloraptor flagellatus]|uniref:Alpha/beta family hydrolase n=1 Tax=Methyloraptor flagellatus TaxID=3162530 RepID=A0AAU7X6U6_9HYPH